MSVRSADSEDRQESPVRDTIDDAIDDAMDDGADDGLDVLGAAELAARWPDVSTVPPAGFRAGIARRLFRQAVRRMAMRPRKPKTSPAARSPG